MDDAAIRERCEEIWRTALKVYEQRGVVPWGEVVIEQMAFGLRAAYADGQRAGMERAAKIADIEMENHAAPHDWMARLAARTISEQIRQAAGEVK